jgi:hypothetical protein
VYPCAKNLIESASLVDVAISLSSMMGDLVWNSLDHSEQNRTEMRILSYEQLSVVRKLRIVMH